MNKEELKEAKQVLVSQIKAEAKEKGLSKAETDKLIKEAVAKLEAENPINDAPATNNVAPASNNDDEVTEIKEKEYVVYTPVKDFNGEVAGVQFAYGKAKVKAGWILDWFKEKGYKVEEAN